jgi:hypothetical protein
MSTSYLSITPNSNNPNSSQIDLKYEVTAVNNTITIIVKPASNNDIRSETIDIQETGAIYVY